MAPERLRFARYERSAAKRDQLPALTVLLFVLGVLMLTRAWWTPSVATSTLVAMQTAVGPVQFERVDAVPSATLAGLGPVRSGDAIVLGEGEPALRPGAFAVLEGGRVNVNLADERVIAALPMVGKRAAAAIVARRVEHGPFHDLADLSRVEGIGKGTIRAMTPYLSFGEVGPAPKIDVNRASAEELERLPGVGPAFAARIIAEREANGPYAELAALTRVSGIGEGMVAKWATLAEVP